MRRTLAILVALTLLPLPVLAAGQQTARNDDGVVVLIYHHFADQENATIVSPWRFEQQMKWLKDHGYHTIGIADLVAYLDGKKDLPKKSVLITMDDGYLSNYQFAYPVLQRYGLKAVIFPIGRWGDEPGPFLPHFTWDQAREMAQAGVVEFGGHTYDLHYYPEGSQLPALEVVEADEALLDLMRSRLRIIDEVGGRAEAFAYPYGWNSERTRELVKQAGFKVAFTVEPGRVYRGMDPYRLPRVNVPGGISLTSFARLLETTSTPR